MVTEEEWHQLSQFFAVDHEISVVRNRLPATANGHGGDAGDDDDDFLVSTPPVCRECLELRHRQEMDERLVSIQKSGNGLCRGPIV
jgi:hypothetical protein